MERHFPEELLYTKDHEWCRVEDGIATIGITWHAQDQLGDIVFCELPGAGDEIIQGETFGAVESVKAVSDLFAPVTGTVVEKNEDVEESPEGLNDDCYDDGWMLKVELKDKGEVKKLMSHADYMKFLEETEE